MPRLAIIDLGTNSVRFDVHDLSERQEVVLHREKLMVRLGSGVFLRGELQPEGIRRTLAAFESFAATARVLRVDRVVAFATAALREASNASFLISKVQEKSGIEIQVISGEREAQLIARGILAHESGVSGQGRNLLVDIGGGSTELSVVEGKRVEFSTSLPLGTTRLQEVFLGGSPPSKKHLKRLREHVCEVLESQIPKKRIGKIRRLVGSSGTVRSLARMLGENGEAFSSRDLGRLVDAMSAMTTRELLKVPRMEPRRADMILAGSLLLEEIATAFGVKKIHFTPYALREGILEHERRRAGGAPAARGDILESVREKARSFDRVGHERRVGGLEQLARSLVKAFAPDHRLPTRLEDLLLWTLLLKDIGRSVSPVRAFAHTAYMLRHLDLPGLGPDEQQWMSLLMSRLDDPSLAKGREAHDRAAGVLWLMEALAPHGQALPKFVRSVRRRGGVELVLGAGRAARLAELRVDQIRKQLRRVWGREVLARDR